MGEIKKFYNLDTRKTRNAIPENSNEDLSNLEEDAIPIRYYFAAMVFKILQQK
jgi:hypothetical protein